MVLVLFEDGAPEVERAARTIADRLEDQGRRVKVSGASIVEVSDLLAAELYILGADVPLSPAYAELARVFKGVNLAGRRAAFFGSSGAAVAWLRGLCEDAELAASHADLAGRFDQAALAAWLKLVSANA